MDAASHVFLFFLSRITFAIEIHGEIAGLNSYPSDMENSDDGNKPTITLTIVTSI